MCDFIALIELSDFLEGSTELQEAVFSTTFQPVCSRFNSQSTHTLARTHTHTHTHMRTLVSVNKALVTLC